MSAHLAQRGREHREQGGQLPTHPGTLRTLAGEEHSQLRTRRAGPRRHGGGRLTGGERPQPGQQFVPARRGDHRTVLQHGPADCRRPADVGGAQFLVVGDPAGPAVGLRRDGGLGAGREQHGGRQRPGGGRRRVLAPGGLRFGGGLLDDHVRVGAADAERRDRGATGPARRGPVAGLGEQGDRPGAPLDVRGRLVDVQRRRQHAVPHRHDHLYDAGCPGGGLGVADVRLDRAQPERPVGRPVLPVRRQQRLRLDRVAQRRAGAVRLHGVHVGSGQPGVREGLPDHPLLRRAIRRRQPVRRAVLVDGAAAYHRQDPPALTLRVRQALHQQHTDALRPARAVGRRRERLAAAVLRQAPLAGELDERPRRRHDGHATGQGEIALAAAQRLHREVQRDQRRRARRVDSDRRAFEAERVRDPAGQHAAGGAGAEVAAHALGQVLHAGGVVVVHEPGEDAGPAAT